MHTLRQIALGLVLVLLASMASAQSVTVTSKARGDYLGGNGAYFYDGFVSQSDIFLSWKNGVYADVWISSAPNTELAFDKELDLIVGYGGKVGMMNFLTDLQYFFVQGIDVANANVEASLGKQTFSPFVRMEVYVPRVSGGPKQGVMFIGGVRNTIPVNPKVRIELQNYLKHDSGAFGFDELYIVQGNAGLAISITDKVTISFGERYAKPLSSTSAADGRNGNATWEIGISRTF